MPTNTHTCTHTHAHMHTNLHIRHTAGDDYSTEVVSFTVPPGMGPITVQLDIVNDDIQENTEQYFGGSLEFSGNSTGAALGISNALMTIIDDDSK